MAYLIFILAAVMGIAGVFGGLINYYQMTQDRDDEAALPRCIVMGIGASFLVPVILFFVQSDLITDIQSDPSKLLDRKSTRLNSSHVAISYAVFCLKKKKRT